ncbi:MAG TPA: tyrosine-type recombinase/integrase [Thermoanaerobaculia bacterium]|nr:tyrosine-type recombinase/integrase [Thermoanaerobaculia bacterium]
MSSNKGKTLPTEPLPREEMRALISAPSRRALSGVRNRALIAVLSGAGLRVQEALDLMPHDVDLKTGEVRVRQGKGKKARVVGLDREGTEIVGRWLECRRRLGLTGRQPLFCTISAGRVHKRGRPLLQRDVRSALQRYKKRAGIERRVHPHGLRATHGVELLEAGFDLRDIQQQFGHSRLSTTAGYIDRIAPRDRVQRVHDRRRGLLGQPMPADAGDDEP